MLKNYLKIAVRHLTRNKSYTIINVVGLGVALAACMLIGLWVKYELSYDQYHDNSDRIYRVIYGNSAATPPTLGPALKGSHPDLIENSVRFWPIQSPSDLVYGDQSFVEEYITYTDPAIFEVFSHTLVSGNPETALYNPNSMVISESLAKKIFGKEDPLGKTLTMWGRDLEITGVFEDVPSNSHYKFNALVPIERLRTYMGNMMNNWSWAGFYTYIIPEEGVNPETIESTLPQLYSKYVDGDIAQSSLQPLTEIYFNPKEKDNVLVSGNITYVYILAIIALFILAVACINFMNLSTAYSALRKKEVGMRKTMGAQKKQLVFQFLGEAVILSFMGMCLALVLVELTVPFFSDFAQKPLTDLLEYNAGSIGGLILLCFIVGIFAGSYPAFFLSHFKPVNSLKGDSNPHFGSVLFRKSLVVFQFVISITLIVAVITVFSQLNYMQEKDLGFDDEQVMITEAKNYPTFSSELKKLPGVVNVSAAYNIPGQRFPYYPYRTRELPQDSLPTMRTLRVNADFIETMGMTMAKGRSFDKERPTDLTSAFIINEAAAAHLGWENPIGKSISWYDFSEDGESFEVSKEGKVIGVVKDFNYTSLHNRVEPLLIHQSRQINSTAIRLKPGDTGETLANIREVFNSVSPGSYFWYYFLDQELDQQYQSEKNLGQIFGGFTLLGLFIGCLGLFGLTAFTARQRTKEIGVRKVLGAGIGQIVILLNKDVVKLVAISLVLAAPISWYFMNQWLADFAYRINFGMDVIALAGFSALAIALLTVSWQSVKAALTNPIESLRNE